MLKKIVKSLNIVSQCRQYGFSLWQCPQFLFVIMGTVVFAATLFSYLIGARYIADPELVALIALLVAGSLLIISFIIIRSFERIAEASRMKSEFINIVSHQLRSPLTNIKWAFEVLDSDQFEIAPEKQEEYFINVRENIGRMVELIDDLLVISRIEEGIFSISKKEISLEDLVEGLVGHYRVFANASHTELNFYTQENLPKVLADPSMIKLVVENLIDNAIRYSRGKGIVEIRLKKRDKQMLFSIKDDGVGIPAKEKKYIFQKFFRAENALKERTKGSGLGLYVCKSIIEKSGGKIWFDSEEGIGTTFYFVLPI